MIVSALTRFPRKNLLRFTDSWREGFRTIRDLADQQEFGSRIMIVHYEDLLLRSDVELARIASFLGVKELKTPEAMSDYGKEWKNNSSFGDLKTTLDTTPIGRWRRMNVQAGQIVELQLADLMQEAGYEASRKTGPIETVRVRGRLLLYHASLRAHRVFGLIKRRLIKPTIKRLFPAKGGKEMPVG